MPPLALIQYWMPLELPADFNEEKQTIKETNKNPTNFYTTPFILWLHFTQNSLEICPCISFALPLLLSSGHSTGKVFIPIPKKGNAKECSNYHTIALISHVSKVMLKILQARLQQ